MSSTADTRAEVLQIIQEQLADILELDDPNRVTESSSFVDDLGADSLALIELVEGIEDDLADRAQGFRIADEDLEDLKTVRDAVDYVTQRLTESQD